jgi:hypothetical protein
LQRDDLLHWEDHLKQCRDCDTIELNIALLTSEYITHLVCPACLFVFLLYYKCTTSGIGVFDTIVIVFNIILFITVLVAKQTTLELYRSICEEKEICLLSMMRCMFLTDLAVLKKRCKIALTMLKDLPQKIARLFTGEDLV